MDRIRPLKFERPATGGTQTDEVMTELNPSEDFVDCKGIAFGTDGHYITTFDNELVLVDPVNGIKKLSIISVPSPVSGTSLQLLIAASAFHEYVRTGKKVSSEIWWTDDLKTQKIREILYTRTAGKISGEIHKQYDPVGSLLETLTITYNRVGGSIASETWVKS